MLRLCRSLARGHCSRSASVLLGSSEEQPSSEPNCGAEAAGTTYCVGNMKRPDGFISGPASTATPRRHSKVYDRKTPIIVADLLLDEFYLAPVRPRARGAVKPAVSFGATHGRTKKTDDLPVPLLLSKPRRASVLRLVPAVPFGAAMGINT